MCFVSRVVVFLLLLLCFDAVFSDLPLPFHNCCVVFVFAVVFSVLLLRFWIVNVF